MIAKYPFELMKSRDEYSDWVGGLQYRILAMIAIAAPLGDDSKVSIRVVTTNTMVKTSK